MGASDSEELFDGHQVIEFADGTDRRNFLRWAGLVGVGASLAVGSGIGASAAAAAPRPATGTGTQKSASDIDILNYALTLEYLEADFYTRGIDCGLLRGRELELVTPIRDHEVAHVAGVTEAISMMGGTPVAKPKFTYPRATFVSRLTFLRQASRFEELGVNAYHGQVPLIQSGDVLAAAASIAGVESRHAAILATLNLRQPFPRPIEQPKPMDEVLAEAGKFIDSGN
ncbi:twin-arginine translocation pathway signal protein [Amycolatopsis antarctica]|uniref:Twin-arginine translocation pathway signal protein n=1 Tax=Amycolatopsis antarctica TaxID=1854586 RepID=A0A263CYQ8_9PSEU|nr:ferritin-like domain-containing protein [Amycolatopsis antarctica]OZM71292.1 twin-arginine translocation pathway signal protein [Amycolatopsis antarctica]